MVVWPLDPDVLNLPSLVWIRGTAGTKLVLKQRLNLLQTSSFGLWQTAVDEEETKQGHAGVEEKSPWETKEHNVTMDWHPQTQGTLPHLWRALSLFINGFSFSHLSTEKATLVLRAANIGCLLHKNFYRDVCGLKHENVLLNYICCECVTCPCQSSRFNRERQQ